MLLKCIYHKKQLVNGLICMVTFKNVKFNLNKYSWSILIAFICATFSMLHHTANISLEDFVQTFPLILVAIYYSEKLAPFINQPDHSLKKAQLFARDLFILSFSFLLGCLLSLILSYNNSDAKGWWTLIVYLITLYGLFFSVLFSTIVLLIENHKKYTIVFSLIIIIFVSIGTFFPHYIFIPLLGNIDTFYVITCLLLIIHLLFAINYKIIRFFQYKKNAPQ